MHPQAPRTRVRRARHSYATDDQQQPAHSARWLFQPAIAGLRRQLKSTTGLAVAAGNLRFDREHNASGGASYGSDRRRRLPCGPREARLWWADNEPVLRFAQIRVSQPCSQDLGLCDGCRHRTCRSAESRWKRAVVDPRLRRRRVCPGAASRDAHDRPLIDRLADAQSSTGGLCLPRVAGS